MQQSTHTGLQPTLPPIAPSMCASHCEQASIDRLHVDAVGDVGRKASEQYVSRVFAKCYRARIREFMPQLISLRSGARVNAVVGVRSAAREALYIESYSEAPIEVLLGQQGCASVRRKDIVEIGNLCSTRVGHGQRLFVCLTQALWLANCSVAVFCATSDVLTLLEQLNIDVHPLCVAEKSCVSNGATQWGSYYENSPTVCAVNVVQAAAAIAVNGKAQALISHFQATLAAIAAQV